MGASVDATGLSPALSLVRLRQALERASTGETVSFLSDASGLEEPLRRFIQRAGHELLSSREEGGGFLCSIRKGDAAD